MDEEFLTKSHDLVAVSQQDISRPAKGCVLPAGVQKVICGGGREFGQFASKDSRWRSVNAGREREQASWFLAGDSPSRSAIVHRSYGIAFATIEAARGR